MGSLISVKYNFFPRDDCKGDKGSFVAACYQEDYQRVWRLFRNPNESLCFIEFHCKESFALRRWDDFY